MEIKLTEEQARSLIAALKSHDALQRDVAAAFIKHLLEGNE